MTTNGFRKSTICPIRAKYIRAMKFQHILSIDNRYDSPRTFKSKIEYANKLGLSGLMVWAIDMDDDNFSALHAIADGAISNTTTDC